MMTSKDRVDLISVLDVDVPRRGVEAHFVFNGGLIEMRLFIDESAWLSILAHDFDAERFPNDEMLTEIKERYQQRSIN